MTGEGTHFVGPGNPHNKNTVFTHGFPVRAVRAERTTATACREVRVQLSFFGAGFQMVRLYQEIKLQKKATSGHGHQGKHPHTRVRDTHQLDGTKTLLFGASIHQLMCSFYSISDGG